MRAEIDRRRARPGGRQRWTSTDWPEPCTRDCDSRTPLPCASGGERTLAALEWLGGWRPPDDPGYPARLVFDIDRRRSSLILLPPSGLELPVLDAEQPIAQPVTLGRAHSARVQSPLGSEFPISFLGIGSPPASSVPDLPSCFADKLDLLPTLKARQVCDAERKLTRKSPYSGVLGPWGIGESLREVVFHGTRPVCKRDRCVRASINCPPLAPRAGRRA